MNTSPVLSAMENLWEKNPIFLAMVASTEPSPRTIS